MAVKPAEHFLFRNYSKALKNWLQENIYLSSYPEDRNVTIVYTTPDRAWAKYVHPTINGGTMSPNVNFHLTGIQYSESENLLGFVNEYIKYDNKPKAREMSPPLIYNLSYSITIYTRLQSEMDVIIYQMVSKAHKNKKAAFKVDGQWAELHFSDIQDETNLEPGEAQDVTTRFGINATIPRAYLPVAFDEVPTIEDFEFTYDV